MSAGIAVLEDGRTVHLSSAVPVFYRMDRRGVRRAYPRAGRLTDGRVVYLSAEWALAELAVPIGSGEDREDASARASRDALRRWPICVILSTAFEAWRDDVMRDADGRPFVYDTVRVTVAVAVVETVRQRLLAAVGHADDADVETGVRLVAP